MTISCVELERAKLEADVLHKQSLAKELKEEMEKMQAVRIYSVCIQSMGGCQVFNVVLCSNDLRVRIKKDERTKSS